MVSKEQFVAKFRLQMCGAMLYGVWTEAQGTPLVRAARALDVVKDNEAFLAAMYDFIAHSIPLTKDAPQPVLPGPVLHKPNKGVA